MSVRPTYESTFYSSTPDIGETLGKLTKERVLPCDRFPLCLHWSQCSIGRIRRLCQHRNNGSPPGHKPQITDPMVGCMPNGLGVSILRSVRPKLKNGVAQRVQWVPRSVQRRDGDSRKRSRGRFRGKQINLGEPRTQKKEKKRKKRKRASPWTSSNYITSPL